MPHATVEDRKKWQRGYCPRYYAANREQARATALRWQYRNPGRLLLMSARQRARKKNIPFNIDLTDIVIPDVCPVLGIPVFATHGKANKAKRNLPNSPSLDRIRPELGYVKGNVQVISWRANDIKRNSTFEEIQLLAAFMMRMQDR